VQIPPPAARLAPPLKKSGPQKYVLAPAFTAGAYPQHNFAIQADTRLETGTSGSVRTSVGTTRDASYNRPAGAPQPASPDAVILKRGRSKDPVSQIEAAPANSDQR